MKDLRNTIVFVEAKNGPDNNMDNPISGSVYANTSTFTDDIVDFILSNDINNWTLVPEEFIDDELSRDNYKFYIKWS